MTVVTNIEVDTAGNPLKFRRVTVALPGQGFISGGRQVVHEYHAMTDATGSVAIDIPPAADGTHHVWTHPGPNNGPGRQDTLLVPASGLVTLQSVVDVVPPVPLAPQGITKATADASYVSPTAAQAFTELQKAQGRVNISAMATPSTAPALLGQVAGYDSAADRDGMRWFTTQEHVARGLGWKIITDARHAGGADPSGTTNSTAAITAALAAAAADGTTVWAPSGEFLIDPISLPTLAKLKGAGPRQTTLTFRNPTNQTFMYATGAFASSATALTADVPAGSQTVTVANASAFAAQQWVQIGDNTVPDSAYSTRKNGELARVISTTGTTVTFESPLHFAYATAQSAFIVPMTSPMLGIEISDLRFKNPSPGTTFASALGFTNCVSVRVENCHFDGMDNPGINLNTCAEWSVRGCHMRNFASDDVNGRYGYGVQAYGACSAGEILDCRFVDVRHAFTTNGLDNGYGQPTDILVGNCHAIACKLAAFDTHVGASGITYVGCVVRGANPTNNPPGFQVRAQRVTLLSCRAFDMGAGNGLAANAKARYLRVLGFEVDGAVDGMLLDGDLTGLHVQGGVFANLTQHGIAFASSCSGSGVIVERAFVRDFGTASGFFGVLVDGSLSFPTIRGNTFQNGYGGVDVHTTTPARPMIDDNVGLNLTAGGNWLNKASGSNAFFSSKNRLVNGQQNGSQIDAVTLASSGTVSWSAGVSDYHRATLQANATASLINNAGIMSDGQIFTVEIVQDATGGRTFTWSAGKMLWAGGAAPTLSTTGGWRDIFQFAYQSSTGNFVEVSRSLGLR